jgi:hypothetical protein
MSPGLGGPTGVAPKRPRGPARAPGASCFQCSRASETRNRSGRRSLCKGSRRKPKRESARAARAEARRRRYWPPQAHGVLDLARVGTPGDRCAGSIVHSVPGGAIGGVDSIFRRNCVSGSGSPPWHHSVYIETDRFSYLTTASPAREASLYILTKPSALQNVSQARRTIQPTPPSAPQPRQPGPLVKRAARVLTCAVLRWRAGTLRTERGS